MAKTKADFEIDGMADAKAGKPRVKFTSDSWQSKAYNAAYTSQVTHEQAKMVATPIRVTTLKRPDQAVIAHMNMLHRMRATTTPERAARLLRKIDILKVRHSPA